MSLIDEAVGLVSSEIHWIKTCLSITRLEATLAGLSVFPLLVFLCVFMVCLMGFWCAILVFFGVVLMQALGNLMVVLGLLCFMNALSLGVILVYLRRYFKRLGFEKTRAYLSAQRGGRA